MSTYRIVHTLIWNDAKFRDLSDDGKLAFFLILTHPHMTAIGAMRAAVGGLADDLGWASERLLKAFQEISSKGLVRVDQRACFVWLPNFLKYNKPQSPNVVVSWGRSLDLIPECALKVALIKSVKAFTEGLGEGFQKALPEAFRKSMPNQEQEQEQEQEKIPERAPENGNSTAPKKGTKAGSPESVPIPATLDTRQFLDAWASWLQHCKELRKKLTASSVKAQFKVFEKWGPERAIAAINHSISKSWQGIFEADSGVNGNGRSHERQNGAAGRFGKASLAGGPGVRYDPATRNDPTAGIL